MDRQSHPLYEFGPFRLDPAEHLLLRDGHPVSLTSKVFDILKVLVENSGHLLEKEELMQAVWPDSFVEEGNLNRNISTLRKILGEGLNGREYIETVPKRGYRFVASVRQVQKEAVDAPLTSRTGAGSRTIGPNDALTRAHELNASPGDDNFEPSTSVWTNTQEKSSIDSLAVLPLVNASADPNMEYLSDGITESIINSLSQLDQLRVVSRSTVFRYKGRDADPQEVGSELGVRVVLTGRVRQFADRLIINTELVDVMKDSQLWGEQYNRTPQDLLAVQEEISREISEKLRLKLSGEQKKLLTKRYTESTEAYQSYLRGRYHWNKRTLEGLRRGIEYFEQAIRIDPQYALAYAGLADSIALLGSVEYGALHPREAMQSAKVAASEALRLDETLAEAHNSLAYVSLFDWDWQQAETEYKRAIELNPAYATAHHWYALYLTAMGRQEEAIKEIKRAQELDPLSLPISLGVGWHYFLTRQYGRAILEYRKALEMDANFYMAHFLLGIAYEHSSMFEEAITEFQTAINLSGGTPLLFAGQGHTYAVWGKRARAQKALDDLHELSKQRYVSPYYIAAIHTGLNEKDQAFKWLRQACENRSEGMVWIKVDPTLDPLRSSPRFTDLLKRVGLAD